MKPSNATIADFVRRYAAVLSVDGADRFKLKAYRRAAETIEGLDEPIVDLVERGSDLTALPGIGKAINEVILEIVRTGKLARLQKSASKLAPEMAELATRPSLDSKRVARIYKKLGINSLQQLASQLEEGKIREVFGARMDFHIRQGLSDRRRMLLWSVEDIAQKIGSTLREIPDVSNVSTAGSLRRKQETIGDLNFLVTGKSATAIFKQFTFGAVHSSKAAGPGARHFKLSSGVTVSLQWTDPQQWGLSLILATGAAAHIEQLKTRAKAKKLSLTARSLVKNGVQLDREKTVYAALGLRFIEPELREGRGEIEAAAKGRLPTLVTLEDLRGDLHMHTTASDGANTIAEMAAAAKQRGYKYIAITDHSQSLKITNGLTETRLLQHMDAIDDLNSRTRGIRILKSAEVDILEDGSLDYSDAVLKRLDFTICSIHSRFALAKRQQTERILRAMDNPYFNILGHATGRLLLTREGYELDFERIIEHAKANGCMFEINSSPNRLDLSDEHSKMAKDAGIKIAINTDAHSTGELNFITAGINQARRAWLERADVLNTYPLAKLIGLLKR